MSALQQLCAAYGAIKGTVVLGIHFDATITDTKGHALTVVGATASTAQAKSGTYSGVFSGNNQYVESTHADFALGNGDFTIEFWAFFNASPPSGGARYFFTNYKMPSLSPYYTLSQNAAGYIVFTGEGTPTVTLTSASIPAASQWTHIAVVRRSGVFKLFVGGVPTSPQSSVANMTGGTMCFGGANNITGGTVFHAGYLDDIRITSGEAIYDADFSGSLPVAPFVDA